MVGASRQLVVSALIICLVTFPIQSLEARQRACQRSGGAFCSAGTRRRGFTGFLDTGQQLREALNATAFLNEIIIFSETRVSEASQALARLIGLGGYAHVLPVMETVADCQHLAHIFAPWQEERGPISCGAYSSRDASGNEYPFKLEYFARSVAGTPAWWRKWLTVARAVALGYNVLAIDADVVVLDDWYWRAKQPPLSLYSMISQAEGGKAINGGFTYVQNAAPNGPVAWLLYEAMFRIVRWAEDPSIIANASSHIAQRKAIMVDDQALLTDAMLSCVAGRPVFWSLGILYRQPGEEAAFGSLGMKSYRDLQRHVDEVANKWEFRTYNVSGPLAAHVCEERRTGPCRREAGTPATTTIPTGVLSMPHSGGQWPLQLGGYPFGRDLGPLASAYRRAFLELGVSLPPDPEDPSTQEAARATPTELVGLLNLESEGSRYLGSWAESTWWSAGRLGYWHVHLWPPPPHPPPAQAMGHLFAGLYPGDFQKTTILQLTGHYDWRVAARLAGSPLRVFQTTTQQPQPDNRPGHRPSDIRVVVAYIPGAVPQDLGKRRFVRAVQGLAQVAAALGAVAAWPAAPCSADWAQARKAAGGSGGANRSGSETAVIPWTHLDTAFSVQPFGDSLEELQCEWVGFSEQGCLVASSHSAPATGDDLDGGRGLMAVEFDHLRQVLGSKAGDDGGPAALVGAGGPGGAPATAAVPAAPRSRMRRRRRLQPHAATTLKLHKEDEAPLTAPADGGLHTVRYDDVVHLNAELVFGSLRRETAAVLWLDRLVESVDGVRGEAAAVYGKWTSRCRALRYYELPKGERESW